MTSQPVTRPEIITQQLTLEPDDNRRLANLCGQLGQHLRQIEQRLDIEIRHRSNQFTLIGPESGTATGAQLLHSLYRDTQHHELTPDEIHLALQSSGLAELTAQRTVTATAGAACRASP